jgi:hypothetical protein
MCHLHITHSLCGHTDSYWTWTCDCSSIDKGELDCDRNMYTESTDINGICHDCAELRSQLRKELVVEIEKREIVWDIICFAISNPSSCPAELVGRIAKRSLGEEEEIVELVRMQRRGPVSASSRSIA